MLFDLDDVLEKVPDLSGIVNTVGVSQYPTVHYDDQNPVSIINPNLKDGPWIAGGAVLNWFQNLPVGHSDIDIFCKDQDQIERVLSDFKNTGRTTEKWNSENAVTLGYYVNEPQYKQWTIQIIKRRTFKDAREIINNFDISVCQLATAGNEYILGKHTAADVRNKKLRMHFPLQPDAVKRYTKYICYGYLPDKELSKLISENPAGKWDFNMQEDYNNAF